MKTDELAAVRRAASSTRAMSERLDTLARSASRAQEEAARIARRLAVTPKFVDREGEQMEADLRRASEQTRDTL